MAKLIRAQCCICQKWFATTSSKRNTCSKERTAIRNKRRTSEKKRRRIFKEQLCWTCQNATGGCSWSKNFAPIEGWDAVSTTVDGEDTYFIKNCPQYEQD